MFSVIRPNDYTVIPMKYLCLLLLTLPVFGQFGAASRILSGTGLPVAAQCTVENNVGLVWARKDGAAVGTTFYVCGSTGVGTYGWQLAGGLLAWEASGSSVGSRSTADVISGFGITSALLDTGTKIQIQTSVDTATVTSRANLQAGSSVFCSSASASSSTYTCGLTPVLTVYTTGMAINWRPDVTNAAGAITLNINTLGSRPIKQADGTTDPGAGALVAGRLYRIWFDGTSWRVF